MTAKQVLNAGQEYRVRHNGTWKTLTFVKTIEHAGSVSRFGVRMRNRRLHYLFFNPQTRRDVAIKSLVNVYEWWSQEK